MEKLFFVSLVFVISACASKTTPARDVSATTPPTPATATTPSQTPVVTPALQSQVTTGPLYLDQALIQGGDATIAYLKSQTTAKPFDGINGRDPMKALPQDLRAERIALSVPPEKKQQQKFLHKFHNWSAKKRLSKGQELAEGFDCKNAIETQAMGFSLELDFPDSDAMETSQLLHEKVLSCEGFAGTESLFRLAIFSIQRGDCSRAQEYLSKFPANLERGVNDRLSYVKSMCSGSKEVAARNPWGGYGILLEDPSANKEKKSGKSEWLLATTSGSEAWDRLLATMLQLTDDKKPEVLHAIAAKLNYEKFRALPLPFQTSMMVVFNYNNADLPIFQTLHKYLSEHPETYSPAVGGLLFPVRYWKEIVGNSKDADPLLVKALIRQESAFNPSARSRVRAAGLMQLIYPTARHFGLKNKKDLMTPEMNISAGSKFLARLIDEFGSVELALAAYNAGPGIVRQWQKRYPTSNIDLFVEMIPYTETREYVRLVSRNYKVYQTMLVAPQVLGDSKK
jgi:soluble lytic murein transglycosylase